MADLCIVTFNGKPCGHERLANVHFCRAEEDLFFKNDLPCDLSPKLCHGYVGPRSDNAVDEILGDSGPSDKNSHWERNFSDYIYIDDNEGWEPVQPAEKLTPAQIVKSLLKEPTTAQATAYNDALTDVLLAFSEHKIEAIDFSVPGNTN